MKSFSIGGSPLIMLSLIIISISHLSKGNAQCSPSETLTGIQAPADQCDPSGSDCCQAGRPYPTYTCSPPVSGPGTSATLTLNSFKAGGDGGGPSECDGQYHSNDTPVVALSTGWYSQGSRCGKQIVINGNGNSVTATVVDECDSTTGCDDVHGYQPPCPNNIVDGSTAVWSALGVPQSQWGKLPVTWSDA